MPPDCETLSPEPDERAEILFAEALAMPAGERQSFLVHACAAEAGLLQEVEGMLADYEKAGSFLSAEAPAARELGAEFGHAPSEQPGGWIGPYKLMERLGEGGFGVVWVAEQERPVRRRVALKIVKPGMDSREVIARFEQERQALALMDHPNIAKVFEAGATPLGRPYFVMELVRGVKITQYCDEARLSMPDRLQLFIQVCHAVQHAHQKGIIHRDLKPSNILVTLHDGVPVPKVIDFGVAKATQQQRLTDLTLYTRFEQMVGTPLYMSPEQAEMSGLDIDTRSDIYSLGVLLYELLTGRTPFDPQTLMERGLDEIRRAVREQEPQKPSTYLSSLSSDQRTHVASRRHTDDTRLASQIRGDLDWIVMKALEKDRTRRYDTATGLAQDIQRHLSSEPVTARPASATYRFRKMVRRNKVAVVAGAAVLAALVIGLGLSVWQSIEKTRALTLLQAAEKAQREERRKAEAEASKSKQVARFLTDMLKGVHPSVAQGRDTQMLHDILEKTADRIETDLKDQPEVEAELRTVLGKVYNSLGDYEKASAMLDRALEMTKRLRGEEHKDVVYLLTAQGHVLTEMGKLDEAEATLRQALAMDQKLAGPGGDVSTSLNSLGLILSERGQYPEAEEIHREALAMRRTFAGNDHEDTANSLNNLAVVLQDQQKFADSESLLREALAIQKKRLGSEHPDVAITLNNLSNAVQAQHKFKESELLFLELLPLQRKLLGNAHPNVAAGLNGLGLAILHQNRAAEAEPILREAVDIEKNARSGPHPQTGTSVGNLGRVLEALGQLPEAESLYREAINIFSNLPGPEHPDTTSWRNQLFNLLHSQKQWPELESLMRESLASARRAQSSDAPHPAIAEALVYLAYSLINQQKFPEAETLLHDANTTLQSMPQVPQKLQREALGLLVQIYETTDRPDKAAEWRQKLADFTKAAAAPKAESPAR